MASHRWMSEDRRSRGAASSAADGCGAATKGADSVRNMENLRYENKKTQRPVLGFLAKEAGRKVTRWPSVRPPHARQGAAVVMVLIIMRACCAQVLLRPPGVAVAAKHQGWQDGHGMGGSVAQPGGPARLLLKI
ncbi:hypothetical protein MASR1M59_01700 [Melaminivora sp.]